MAGRQECGKSGWDWAPVGLYENLALEKQHFSLFIDY